MAAPNGAVAATAIFTALRDRAQDGLGAELGEGGAALLRRRPVDGEDAVEMVELVLDDPGFKTFGLDPEVLPGRRNGLHRHGQRTLDLDDDRRGTQREAA